MQVGYDIGGGGLRRFDGEHLRILADGHYERWVLDEAPVVGAFAGSVPAEALAEIARLAAAAEAAGTLAGATRPGGRAERWFAGSAAASFAVRAEPDGAWGALVSFVRGLLPTFSASDATLALEVADDWRTATLRAAGPSVLGVAPVPLTVEVAVWKGYYEPVGTWSGSMSPGPDAGAPGWTLPIPLGHRFSPKAGRVLHVKVGVTVLVDGGDARLVPTVAPHMAEPEEPADG